MISGDCNDASAVYHALTKRYKDLDNDGYSDGTMIEQCGQPTNYKLATQLTATTGDCDETNDLLNAGTIRYQDSDGDGFSDGTTSGACTDPGTVWYLPSQLLGTAGTGLTLTNGLIGYRSFDGNNGNDRSGNGHTGTVYSGTSFT